jgi:glycosyltransferase involved in cell wall biosynthesis
MTTDTNGGLWRYSIELADALQHQDVQIALAAIGGRPLDSWQREQIAAAKNLTLFENPRGDIQQSALWLLDIEAQFEPDVIHLNGAVHGHHDFDAPVIVVAHSCELSRYRAIHGTLPPQWQAQTEFVRKGLEGVELVIAPTDAVMQNLQEFYGPLARTQVIHHGIHPGRFQPGVKQNFILSSGGMADEAKNIAALEHLAPQVPWPIHIIGDGQHLDETAIAHELSEAAIFAMPALYEPFGLSILEAAMSGCALILGDVPSLHELWYESALFVPGDDLSAIRDELRHLIAQPEDRQRLGDAARERAARYTSSAMAKSYLAAYRQLYESQYRPIDVEEPPVERTFQRPVAFSQQRIA